MTTRKEAHGIRNEADRGQDMPKGGLIRACVLIGAAAVSGCSGGLPFGREAPVQTGPALDIEQADGSRSEIIDALLARPSVLETGTFSTISDAVMAANARASEAELRAAILRSEATQANWLPTLSPQATLTDLGTVVAQLVVDQVLFDNGRKRAEREIARADVEAAAVALSQDSNERVLAALELYVTAEASEARAAVNAAGLERMRHFEWVMSERVAGGINDQADLAAVSQRLSQLEAELATDREAAARSLAELSALIDLPVDQLDGVSQIAAPGDLEPLSVLRARATASRSLAQAQAARAGYLPGVSLGATVTPSGTRLGLSAAAQNALGFGTGASLQAIEAAEQASQARVIEAQRDAERTLRGLEAELVSLRRQSAEADRLAAEAARTYNLFNQQLEAGQRAVPDVIGVFETRLRTERNAVGLRYDVMIVQLRIAALRGALVEGHKA